MYMYMYVQLKYCTVYHHFAAVSALKPDTAFAVLVLMITSSNQSNKDIVYGQS